jgi:hypothetical protein
MYDAGSPAVSALDTIVARRALSVWKCAYAAGAAAEREMFAKAGIRLLKDDQQQ